MTSNATQNAKCYRTTEGCRERSRGRGKTLELTLRWCLARIYGTSLSCSSLRLVRAVGAFDRWGTQVLNGVPCDLFRIRLDFGFGPMTAIVAEVLTRMLLHC